MTREELKDIVRHVFHFYDANAEDSNWTDMNEACGEIIKAIEQESCEDAVSRTAVKEGMIKYGFRAPDMTVTEFIEDELQSITPTLLDCEDVISKKEVEQLFSPYFDKETNVMKKLHSLPPVTPKLPGCVDAVSRSEVDKLCYRYLKVATDEHVAFYEHFLDLPSATPARKKGKWILAEGIKGKDNVEKCSCCGSHWKEAIIYRTDTREYLRTRLLYCPNCGAEMEEE